MICPVAAKPPLRHAARWRHAKGKAASNEPAGKEFMDDLKVVVGIDLGRGKDAVFTVDFKDGDRTMRSWELEGAALCAGKTVRL
ncbi:hypothetical protein [Rhizobium laguerreae]|uniref:hypothetical protein n=1 Tax=Rhizobium laguerreae TaxID=1076926 RepID=UPI001441DB6F